MLYAVLTSLGVVAAFVAIAAGFVAFVSGARAVGYRGSQLLSGDVKALQRPGAETTAEGAENSVKAMQRRMLKSMLVAAVAVLVAAGLALLRNWLLGRFS